MTSYPYRCGEALDEGLNVVLFNGDPHVTISEHAADAQHAKRRWGCVLCQWLSWTVERNHCAKTLAGTSMTRLGALFAGAQLVTVAIVLRLLVRLVGRLLLL